METVSVVRLESAPGLESEDSDSDSNFSDSDLDLDSDPKDSDLDSDFAHETKVKVIHELLVNDWSQEKLVFPSRA